MAAGDIKILVENGSGGFDETPSESLTLRLLSIGIGIVPTAKSSIKSLLSSEVASLGSELITSSGWTTSGWTGSFNSFTHTVGNTNPLSWAITTSVGQRYLISWSITGLTTGGYFIGIGGVSTGGKAYVYDDDGNVGIICTGNGNLTITPSSTLTDGTISNISVKLVSTAINPSTNIFDSNEDLVFEARYGTLASANIFLGKNAGRYNYSGSGNLGIGIEALQFNISGLSNLALGYGSLGNNSCGCNNLGIGSLSLTYNTIGNYNTAIGYSSLFHNISGNYNTAFGGSTLVNNTTGSSNVAIGGYGVLASNQSGSNNVAIGGYSLYSCTGSSNVAIGINSLYYITTSSAVAIGYNAGRYLANSSSNLTSAEYSVFIGSSSKSLADSQTNEIVIGYNAIGNGSNTVTLGNTSIIGTYLSGTLYAEKYNLSNTLASNLSYSGIIETITVGESVVFGDVLYLKFSDGKYWKAKADAYSTTPTSRMALASISANASGLSLVEGFVRYDSWSFAAANVWLSAATAGAITSTQPTTTTNQIQKIGVAFASNKLHFRPSFDIGEL